MTRVADFGVFVQIEGMVEGLMHVSETPIARGQKPQDHYKEGDPVRARILRIEDAEMKVGLSGLQVDEAATAASDPEASSATTGTPEESSATAAPSEPATASDGGGAQEEADPKEGGRGRRQSSDACCFRWARRDRR